MPDTKELVGPMDLTAAAQCPNTWDNRRKVTDMSAPLNKNEVEGIIITALKTSDHLEKRVRKFVDDWVGDDLKSLKKQVEKLEQQVKELGNKVNKSGKL